MSMMNESFVCEGSISYVFRLHGRSHIKIARCGREENECENIFILKKGRRNVFPLNLSFLGETERK